MSEPVNAPYWAARCLAAEKEDERLRDIIFSLALGVLEKCDPASPVADLARNAMKHDINRESKT